MASQPSRFGITADTWEQAVDEIYDLLVRVARRGATVTYSELAQTVRTVSLDPDDHAFHWMLGDASRRSFDEGALLLSAIVVSKGSRRPGAGFFDLARGLGHQIDEDRESEDLFWGGQVEQVHNWWRRR